MRHLRWSRPVWLNTIFTCITFFFLFPFTYQIEKRAELKQWSSSTKKTIKSSSVVWSGRSAEHYFGWGAEGLGRGERAGNRCSWVDSAADCFSRRSFVLLKSHLRDSVLPDESLWQRERLHSSFEVRRSCVFFFFFWWIYTQIRAGWGGSNVKTHNSFRQPSVLLLLFFFFSFWGRNLQRPETRTEDPSAYRLLRMMHIHSE